MGSKLLCLLGLELYRFANYHQAYVLGLNVVNYQILSFLVPQVQPLSFILREFSGQESLHYEPQRGPFPVHV